MRIFKRLLYLLLCTFLVVAIILLGVRIYKKKVVGNSETMISNMNSDRIKEFVFSFKEDTPPMQISLPAANTRSIPMQLDTERYIMIDIPSDITYCTDFATFIYDVNGTFRVTRLSGIDPYDLELSTGMKQTAKLSSSMIAEKKPKAKEWRVVKAVVNDIAVIASSRGNSEAYATIEESLFNNPVKSINTLSFILDEDDYKVSMNAITLPVEPDDSSEVFDTKVELVESYDIGQTNYVYEKSFLSSFNMLSSYENTIETIKRRVAIIGSNGLVAQQCVSTDKLFFIQSGEVYALVLPYTSNQSFALLGYGKEAGFNIIQYGRLYQSLNK